MKTLWLLLVVLSFWVLFSLVSARTNRDGEPRKVLVLGGNGMLGSPTVDRLIRLGDEATLVIRGNWYFDSSRRIRPYVKIISCDRKNGIESCEEFVKFVQEAVQFTAVIDFTAHSYNETRDLTKLLKNKARLLIHISNDHVYDLNSSPGTKELGAEEHHASWPEDPHRLGLAKMNMHVAVGKMEAEDGIVQQRLDGGIPYVILRLPDVIGPRDTTSRFWLYQLWLKVYPHVKHRPVTIPKFLKGYPASFVYSEDVAKKITELIDTNSPDIVDQVFNLAWTETVTLAELLNEIQANLHLSEMQELTYVSRPVDFFYPTSRAGPLNTTKAQMKMDWKPLPWREAVRETVAFYEKAMTDEGFKVQMDEILQVTVFQLFGENRREFFQAIEKAYGINLTHFLNHKDEL